MFYSEETLDLVKKSLVPLAVMSALARNGVEVVSSDRTSVVAQANCLPVTISWEMCSCHGGRMWFNQRDTNIHVELSSSAYCEDLGIDNPETELAYYIDCKMADMVKEFAKYVYVVTVTGEYTEGKVDVRYHKTLEDASFDIYKEHGHDAMSEPDDVIHHYPNPDCVTKVSFDHKDDNGDLWYKGTYFSDYQENPEKVEREYDIKLSVFRKKR